MSCGARVEPQNQSLHQGEFVLTALAHLGLMDWMLKLGLTDNPIWSEAAHHSCLILGTETPPERGFVAFDIYFTLRFSAASLPLLETTS